MRILGIDPGLRRTGWGVVALGSGRLTHVASGVCLSGDGSLAVRLARLYEEIEAVLRMHAPDEAAVEQTFVNKDAAGTLKLGQARAVALVVPARHGLPVAEYAPNAVKKAVVGVGHADKGQVAHMISTLLPGSAAIGPDASDALAIAVCHAWAAEARDRRARALAGAGAQR